MFVIVKVTRSPHIDEYGEFDYDYDSEYFVGIGKFGLPQFSFDSPKEFNDREEAESVIESLKEIYDNSKRLYSRIYFSIEEVRAA